MKLEMTEMGKVKPVITVLRQDFKNNNTMATVSNAPSSKVFCTPFREAFTQSLFKLMVRTSTSGGICFCSSSKASLMPSPVVTMLASCCLKTSIVTALCSLMRAMESNSRSRKYRWPRSATVMGSDCRCITTTEFKSKKFLARPSMRRIPS